MTDGLSIIIPTYNERHFIGPLLDRLQHAHGLSYNPEIIVVDGGSTDGTADLIPYGVRLIHSPVKRRSVQLNMGAEMASGKTLYFVHADSLPPQGYGMSIEQVMKQTCSAGCFTSVFDWPHPFLRFCNWFSRWPYDWCRGGGQTLYVNNDLFKQIGGFDREMYLMEEYDLIQRLKEHSAFSIIKKNVITSARDYREHGAFRLQFIYARIMWHFFQGASQQELVTKLNEYLHGTESRHPDKSMDNKS